MIMVIIGQLNIYDYEIWIPRDQEGFWLWSIGELNAAQKKETIIYLLWTRDVIFFIIFGILDLL